MEHKLRLEFKDIWPELELVEANRNLETSNWRSPVFIPIEKIPSLSINTV